MKICTDLSLRAIKTATVEPETLKAVFSLLLLLVVVLLDHFLVMGRCRVGVHHYSRLADHINVESGNDQGEENKH